MLVLITGASTTALAAAALIASVVGIGNLAYSFFNGKWDRRDRQADAKAEREQALTLAREEREHQLDVQRRESDHRLQVLREERLFEQRRDAYLDSLNDLGKMHEWAASTYPMWSRGEHDPRPSWNPPPDVVGVRAALFAAPDVWDGIREFRTTWLKFRAVAEEMDAYVAQRKVDDQMKTRERLDEGRDRLSERLVAIQALMRDDLWRPPPEGA